MFLRRCTFLLLLCLIASDANAARKTKRPVKPAKQTIPRTNVTPAAAAPAATTSSASASSSSSTTATSEQNVDAAPLTTSSNNELPKPLLVAQNDAPPEPKTDKAPELDEECDPDMIGFEIITGWV